VRDERPARGDRALAGCFTATKDQEIVVLRAVLCMMIGVIGINVLRVVCGDMLNIVVIVPAGLIC